MYSSENEGVSLSPNNIHFTYESNIDRNSLCQGDVLERTEELENILKEIHPYFINETYKYYIVLSQSCDLVRRNGKSCKTPYITLAAIRSYDSFLKKELLSGKYADEIDGLLLMDEKQKERAYQLLERIYNNTEPEYFFLYKEESIGLRSSMVAYLKVSIALKSTEHYEACLRAKRIELKDEFKAKLGWLVGNMYSRVGTTDWDSIMTSQQKKEMLNNDITSRFIVGSKEQLKQLKDNLKKDAEDIHSHDDAVEYVSNIRIPTKYENVIEVLEDIIKTADKKITVEQKQKLLSSIKSRQALKVLLSK